MNSLKERLILKTQRLLTDDFIRALMAVKELVVTIKVISNNHLLSRDNKDLK